MIGCRALYALGEANGAVFCVWLPPRTPRPAPPYLRHPPPPSPSPFFPLSCTRPPRTLAELNLPHACREVVDKDADAVLDEIEAAVYLVAKSILQGEGFGYDVPSRSKGNQIYVPELDRIVLKDVASFRAFAGTQTVKKTAIMTRILQLVHELCTKRIHVTKRDLFYTDVKLFEVRGWGLSFESFKS
jgi:hypothetical protein